MSASDLHDRLVTEINRRLEIARAATPGPWDYSATRLHMNGSGTYRIAPVVRPQVLSSYMRGGDPEHIALHGPDDAIRRYEADLRRLERHVPKKGRAGKLVCEECDQRCHSETGLMCDDPDAPYPCDEIREVAASLGIDPDGGRIEL